MFLRGFVAVIDLCESLRIVANGQMLYCTFLIRTDLVRRYCNERLFVSVHLLPPLESIWLNSPGVYCSPPWYDRIPF